MNIVYVLMIVTSNGLVESPKVFATLADCQIFVERVQMETFCAEKKYIEVTKNNSKLATFFEFIK